MADDDVQTTLERIGINVPVADLPFLRRARQRQQELLNAWSSVVPHDSEPATIFRAEIEHKS